MSRKRTSLVDLQSAARAATTLPDFLTPFDRIDRKLGPEVAAPWLGDRWIELLSRKRTAEARMRKLIHRTQQTLNVDIVRAGQIVGWHMMDEAERAALALLVLQQSEVTIYSVTDLSHFTGWFQSLDQARQAWTTKKPPIWYASDVVVPWRDVIALKLRGNVAEFVRQPLHCLENWQLLK